MSTVKLTRNMTAEIVSKNTLKVVTKQTVRGGGSLNVVLWALRASKLGYKTLLVELHPRAPHDVRYAINDRIKCANEMVNHLGLEIREA